MGQSRFRGPIKITQTGTSTNAGNQTIAGTLAVTGATTLTGNVTHSGTLAVTGALTASSTAAITGAVTASSTLAVTGAVTASSTMAVTGAITATGGVVGTLTGNQLMPSATVAAAGSIQGDATAFVAGFTLVTAADATKGAQLPAAAAGKICIVKNADAANAVLKIWPATGDGINAVAVNSAYSMAANTCSMFIAYDATTWYSLPLLAS